MKKLYLLIILALSPFACATGEQGNSTYKPETQLRLATNSGNYTEVASIITKNNQLLENEQLVFDIFRKSIYKENYQIVDFIITKIKNLNYLSENGRTYIMASSLQKNTTKYLEYFLTNSNLIDHKTNDGSTAFSIAAAVYNISAMKLLIKNGAKDLDSHATSTAVPLNVAVAHQDVELVEMMLEHGADPNHQYEVFYKEFPLQIAIEKNNPDIIKLLLKYKADPNKLTCYGETPLYLAQQGYVYNEKDLDSEQKEIVGLLKSYKAELPKTKPRNRATSGSSRRPGC